MEKTLGSHSLFKRFLLSLLAVFLIPFLTILVIYNTASGMVYEEIVRAGQSSLYQFVSLIDGMFSEGVTAISQVTVTPQFVSFALKDEPRKGTAAYNLKNLLTASRSGSLQDVMVYYPGSGQVISQNRACLSSELFYETYYEGTFASAADFHAAIGGNCLGKVRLTRFGMDGDVALMYTSMSSLLSSALQFNAVAVLNPLTLSAVTQEACSQSGSVLMLFNEERELLFASESVEGTIDWDALKSGQGYADARVNGQSCILQMYEGGSGGTIYVLASPTRLFWQRMTRLRTLSLGSVLLCLVLSVLLSVMLTRRNYRPIDTLVRTAQEKTGIDYDRRDGEMEYLAQVLDSSITRGDLLADRMSQMHNTLTEGFLLRAMRGTVHAEEGGDEEDAFAANGIELLSDGFCVLLIRLEDADEHSALAAEDYIRRLNGRTQGMQRFSAPLSPDLYAMVINFAGVTDGARCAEEIDALCRTLSQELDALCSLVCTVAVGAPHHGLSGIRQSYEEAVSALRYRFVRGKGSINRYTPEEAPLRSETLFGPEAAQLLVQSVRGDQYEIDQAFSRALLEKAHIDRNATLQSVECYRYDVVSTLNKIILEVGAGRLEQEKHFLTSLIQADTLEQFQDRLLEALSGFRQFYSQLSEQNNVCSQAMRLIESSYMDAELNNNVIADRLYISSGYLSKLFRLRYGQSMMDCLYRLRIRRTKELLRGTQATIDEIAEKTGFASGSALIKMFKKYEGLTPGAYRRLTGAECPEPSGE